ncbi:hypothetical protein J8273_7946 [Carpediemonas membranifera]|uniref:Uncharacterized protein n=1 Tax=Carpediemonas membranifera TaxID=201153 RepID=A0A8J6E7D4_9EUKA|nr:hypothetical protein J8273_7946 [Carpediemonas membranifera]|eukprot:KAG9390595.1 hypothetical protein J8273_7946 [Carpediemonas membranifera]
MVVLSELSSVPELSLFLRFHIIGANVPAKSIMVEAILDTEGLEADPNETTYFSQICNRRVDVLHRLASHPAAKVTATANPMPINPDLNRRLVANKTVGMLMTAAKGGSALPTPPQFLTAQHRPQPQAVAPRAPFVLNFTLPDITLHRSAGTTTTGLQMVLRVWEVREAAVGTCLGVAHVPISSRAGSDRRRAPVLAEKLSSTHVVTNTFLGGVRFDPPLLAAKVDGRPSTESIGFIDIEYESLLQRPPPRRRAGSRRSRRETSGVRDGVTMGELVSSSRVSRRMRDGSESARGDWSARRRSRHTSSSVLLPIPDIDGAG